MPLTSLLGWKQLSIAVLLLFAPASCTALLMIQRDFDSRYAGLNIKVDHTSDNNTLNLQQVTLAQLNTWRVDSQFAELAGNFAACCRMRTFLRNPSKGKLPVQVCQNTVYRGLSVTFVQKEQQMQTPFCLPWTCTLQQWLLCLAPDLLTGTETLVAN